MALIIRDGNQSATTLSTILVNSAHVPAHTVVSLGSQAITDIAQAVSGVELGPNTLNALESISVTISAGTSITVGNVVSVTGGLTNTELRASAVTIGGSVQVSNLPATQAVTFGGIQGSVTAVISGTPSVTISNFPATQAVTFSQASVTFGSVSISNFPPTQIVSGTVTIGSSVTVGGTVTANVFGLNSGGVQTAIPVQNGNEGNLAFSGIPIAWNDDNAPDTRIAGTSYPLPIQAPQGIGISGTVTANVLAATSIYNEFQYLYGNNTDDQKQTAVPIGFNDTDADKFYNVSNNNPLPISGTVTANFGGNSRMIGTIAPFGSATTGYVAIADDGTPFGSGAGRLAVDVIGNGGTSFVDECVINNAVRAFGTVTLGTGSAQIGSVTASVTNSVTVGSLPVQLSTTTIGGTARLNVTLSSATTVGGTAPSYANLYGGSDGTNLRAILTDTAGRSVVTVSNFPASQTISGTVTATLASTTVTVSALPSGALTTRFGSVTTANTAQITAAVTNTSRKYLLAQNISAGTVTIGIGFSPTTTQGIQLTAGGGLTFDTFCPTGAVYWLGATTGANFTILEG